MPYYSIADILLKIGLLFDWIDYLAWSIYDSATNSRISPYAVINDLICSQEYMGSGLYKRRDCLLTPDYCEIRLLCTWVAISFVYAFGVAFICFLYCCSPEKSSLLKAKETWSRWSLEKKRNQIEWCWIICLYFFNDV